MKYDLFVPKKVRQVLTIIFFYGAIINVAVFMFLFVALYHGYNPIEKILTFFS